MMIRRITRASITLQKGFLHVDRVNLRLASTKSRVLYDLVRWLGNTGSRFKM